MYQGPSNQCSPEGGEHRGMSGGLLYANHPERHEESLIMEAVELLWRRSSS